MEFVQDRGDYHFLKLNFVPDVMNLLPNIQTALNRRELLPQVVKQIEDLIEKYRSWSIRSGIHNTSRYLFFIDAFNIVLLRPLKEQNVFDPAFYTPQNIFVTMYAVYLLREDKYYFKSVDMLLYYGKFHDTGVPFSDVPMQMFKKSIANSPKIQMTLEEYVEDTYNRYYKEKGRHYFDRFLKENVVREYHKNKAYSIETEVEKSLNEYALLAEKKANHTDTSQDGQRLKILDYFYNYTTSYPSLLNLVYKIFHARAMYRLLKAN